MAKKRSDADGVGGSGENFDANAKTQSEASQQQKDQTKSRRPKSIDEALKVLDEALAGPASELRGFVSDEIENLNSTVQSTLGSLRSAVEQTDLQGTKERVGDAVQDITDTIKSAAEKSFRSVRSEVGKVAADSAESVAQFAEDFAAQGVEYAREAYRKADAEVRSNPWPYIGGIAVGTFALGALLGSFGQRQRD